MTTGILQMPNMLRAPPGPLVVSMSFEELLFKRTLTGVFGAVKRPMRAFSSPWPARHEPPGLTVCPPHPVPVGQLVRRPAHDPAFRHEIVWAGNELAGEWAPCGWHGPCLCSFKVCAPPGGRPAGRRGGAP